MFSTKLANFGKSLDDMRYSNKVILNLAFAISIFFSCNSYTESNSAVEEYLTPDDLFANAIEIKGEKLQHEMFAKPFFKGFLTNDGFLGYLRADNDKLVHLLNAGTGKIMLSEGTKGRGPNELLMAHALDYNPQTGSLFLHDIMKSVAVQFAYRDDKIINIGAIDLAQRGLGCITEELQTVSDSLFILRVNDIAPPYSCYLAVVDSHNTMIDSLQIFQIDKDKINHSKIRIIDASMRLSPNRKDLFLCNSNFNHITRYSIENNRLKKIKSSTILKPEYTIKRGKIIMDNKHIVWNGEIFTSDKYVYVVSNPEVWGEFLTRVDDAQSSGRVVSEFVGNTYILVFDYDLNFIKSYKTDNCFKWIAVAPDGKTVYASTYLDGCYLTKYNLEGLN